MRKAILGTCVLVVAAMGVSTASAQQTIPAGTRVLTQWGFNASVAGFPSSGNIAVGTGTITNGGLGSSVPFVNANPNFGAANDNNAVGINGGPAQARNLYLNVNAPGVTAASGLGVRFNTSTLQKEQISLVWDMQIGSRASKYWQVYYTVNGSTWQPAPANGTSSSPTILGTYTSATVSNGGLITITAPAGITQTTMNTNGATNWMYPFTYSFPVGGAWENNPSFGFGLYAVHNPFQTDTGAADFGYVSAQTGLNATDTTTGFSNSTTAATAAGGVRLDMVTVAGIPEPTGLGLLVAVGAFAVRRRQR